MSKVNLDLQSPDQSTLWQRLDEELKPKVRQTAESAAALLGDIARNMPLYTFHNQRHILNILGWMDWLLADVTPQLAPLEAALCILAAYTHDLGMALPAAENTRLRNGEDPEFQRFRDRFPEHNRHIERLRKEGHHPSAQLIEDHLVTDYLRTTHADTRAARLHAHLNDFPPDSFQYGPIHFRRELELIAISHNQPVAWLRHELGPRLATPRANFAFPGLVLRLADIMDFDASRTPDILFHHLGLGDNTNPVSEREWRKHMAITDVEAEPAKVTYHAWNCPDPVTEKCIRQFVDWIQDEVTAVRGELPQITARAGLDKLRLPEVEHKITPKPGAYVYHDWSFHLDHEEIINLLMGESLYGDPSLCIRELLQNALDAVELADMRLQLEQKRAGVETTPGKFRDHLGVEHEFAVNLTWGHDDAKGWWIQVSDNGVGMTEDAVKRYFTRLGKSFYRSPEFKAEQEEMRRHGLLCTPISTFGIGVLSCFMIADQIEVRTNAGDGKALDFHVSGPGSLFWANAGSRKAQGTDVKLWLKPGLSLGHNWNWCVRQLQGHFGYRNLELDFFTWFSDKPSHALDPFEAAARHLVWPKYPVRVSTGADVICIDKQFHLHTLAPLDSRKIQSVLSRVRLIQKVPQEWGTRDWTDAQTGSRVLIWIPNSQNRSTAMDSNDQGESRDGFPFWAILNLIDYQLKRQPTRQERQELTLAHSMYVEEAEPLRVGLGMCAAPGCRLWIDFRGAAAPRLSSDRRRTLLRSAESDWRAAALSVWDRFTEHLCMEVCHNSVELETILLFPMQPVARRQLSQVACPVGTFELSRNIYLYFEGLSHELSHDHDRARVSLDPSPPGQGLSERKRQRSLKDLIRDSMLLHILELGKLEISRQHESRSSETIELDPTRPLDFSLALVLGLEIGIDLETFAMDLCIAWHKCRTDALAASHVVQEGFRPCLEESWPPLGMYGRTGYFGEGSLAAPAACHFGPRAESRLDALGFDLCFPLTAIPLAKLRRDAPGFVTDRKLRLLGTAPFLFPSNHGTWQANAEHFCHELDLDSLYAFLPAYDLWWKPFAEWTPEDERHPDNVSLFWNITTGDVLAYPGLLHRDQMKPETEGVIPFDQYAEDYVKSKSDPQQSKAQAAF
ncbi:MAG: ATP-binding protein [Bryobacteraceae bacterium]